MTDPQQLPADGTPLRIGAWRLKVMWAGVFVIALIALSVLAKAIQIGSPVALLLAVSAIFGLGVFVRIPLSGVIFEQWNEIERFELREKGERPRFRIRLRE